MADIKIMVGNKIEMTKVQRNLTDNNEDEEHRVYVSQIFDLHGDTVRCAMPIYEGHLIPLEPGTRYDMFFYTDKGVYKSVGEIINRGKEENLHFMDVILISELLKYQRREYYRLECNIETKAVVLTESEYNTYLKNSIMPETLVKEIKNCNIVDISGGGAKIVSKHLYEKNEMLSVSFCVILLSGKYEINLAARVVESYRHEEMSGVYYTRIQYKGMKSGTRELIVKYIFEEQRKISKKERGYGN